MNWDPFFEPKKIAGLDDWLHEFPEEIEGQTFNSWYKYIKNKEIHSFLSNPQCDCIGFINVGTSLQSFTQILSEITSAFYFGINIDTIKAISMKNIKSRYNEEYNTKQLLTTSVEEELNEINREHSNLCCLMGVTMIDLYPDNDWDYVFGSADDEDCVAIFSFMRYFADFDKIMDIDRYNTLQSVLDGKEQRRSLFIKRCVQTLVHEIGHLFGFSHCPYFECVMNGSNDLIESDSQPIHFCPICLHKLYFAIMIKDRSKTKRKHRRNKKNKRTMKPMSHYLDILSRYNELNKLFIKYGLMQDALWYQQRVKFIEKKLKIDEDIIL